MLALTNPSIKILTTKLAKNATEKFHRKPLKMGGSVTLIFHGFEKMVGEGVKVQRFRTVPVSKLPMDVTSRVSFKRSLGFIPKFVFFSTKTTTEMIPTKSTKIGQLIRNKISTFFNTIPERKFLTFFLEYDSGQTTAQNTFEIYLLQVIPPEYVRYKLWEKL